MKQYNHTHSHLISNKDLQSFNQERRKALHTINALGIISIGSIIGSKTLLDNKDKSLQSLADSDIFNQINTTRINNTQNHNIVSSLIPKEILDLPVESFSIPHHLKHIITNDRLQFQDMKFIMPLVTNKYLDDFSTYINLKIKHKNLEFFNYHYTNFGSLIKDLESKHYFVRLWDFNKVFHNDDFYKEAYSLLHTNYNLDNDRYFLGSLNHLYNESLKELEYLYKYQQHNPRVFAKLSDDIGSYNMRLLYMPDVSLKYDTYRPLHSNPKFIGRLATTIIIEDGLWIG